MLMYHLHMKHSTPLAQRSDDDLFLTDRRSVQFPPGEPGWSLSARPQDSARAYVENPSSKLFNDPCPFTAIPLLVFIPE